MKFYVLAVDGVVSLVNETAYRLGVRIGEPAFEEVRTVASALGKSR